MIEIKLDTSNVPLIVLGNAPFDYALVKMKDGTEHFCKAEPYHGEPPSLRITAYQRMIEERRQYLRRFDVSGLHKTQLELVTELERAEWRRTFAKTLNKLKRDCKKPYTP